MTPDEYCKDKASNSGSSFYYSFLFLTPEKNQAITALYAFCREVDDIVDECREPEIARTKLQWWREEIANTFAGSAQHPVTLALSPAIKRYSLPQEYFIEIIDGMEMDLDQTRYDSFKDLSLYCYRAASVVGLLSAEIFGYENRQTLKYAHNLGTALQLTNILRDVREDAARGRIYIPLDELERFGVSENDILAGNMSEQMRDLFQHQAQRARHYYEQAHNLLPEADRFPQLSGLVMGAIYQRILDRITNNRYDVMNTRASLKPLHKLWIAWKTVRTEKRIHRRLAAA